MQAIVRVRFERKSSMQFVSHLEMMKVFQRAMRRTSLKPAYSQGFNPQMKMVFGLPLPVGTTSESEYVDLYFDQEIKAELVYRSLKQVMPPGIVLMDAKPKTIKKNIMADIGYALYRITFNQPVDKMITFINTTQEWMVLKKTKSSESTVNLKTYIYTVKAVGSHEMEILLKAGQNNLSIHTLLEGLQEQMDASLQATAIHRLQLYVERDGKPCHPMLKEALENE